ncbi:MAG: UPF0104 family protein [Bacteroidetes bacterium]|nr:MAG: UPF0104 family protein [Bacteroidota bacterium]
MKRSLKTIAQLLLGLGIAGLLLYLTFRDSSLGDIIQDMRAADPFWLGMGALALLLMFLFRALRWQMMLVRSGHPAGLFAVTLSTLITYLVNSLTPKLGEVARCSVLLKTDKVPISTSLGTVVSERVADMLVLLLGVGIIFLLEINRLGDLFGSMFAHLLGEDQLLVLGGLAIVGMLGLVAGILFLRSERFKTGLMGRIQVFLKSMFAAASSVLRLRRPWLFGLYTGLIWFFLVLMNYFFMLALPATSGLSFYFAVLILFIGGLGWALPVPGGIGTTHFIVLQIFLAFLGEAGREPGLQIGLLSNGATFLFNVGFGLLAWFAFLWLVFRSGADKKNPGVAHS